MIKENIFKKISNENILMDDGEENGNGEEEGFGKGLNIEDLINLIQEATTKHLTDTTGSS